MNKETAKKDFERKLAAFATGLQAYVSDAGGRWTIKGFIDAYKNVYTLTSDTKIVSKVLEIHLFPQFLNFATENGFQLIPAEKQNWYPDITFVSIAEPSLKFAVDLKTTYRIDPGYCNGFTLGSHGEYFVNRTSAKNVQYPYGEYYGHYILGVIYSRNELSRLDGDKVYSIGELDAIPSVIESF